MRYSVRDLDHGEMIAVSGEWLGQQLSTFKSIPELEPLIPQAQEAHNALLAARGETAATVELRRLSEAAHGLDNRHDHTARAAYYYLLARRAYLLGKEDPDPEGVEAVDHALDTLFPDNLEIVNASYQSEAGTAQQMAAQAAGELKAVLSTIPVEPKVTLAMVVTQLGSVGQQLGEIERKKSEAARAAGDTSVPPAELRRRMRAWADIAETVLANLKLSKAPAARIDAIRQPLIEAATKATARRRARRRKNEPTQEPTP